MANKEFKIQSDTISLNGVPLSSSADGKVVLPGVTRATNYVVKEVDDVEGDEGSPSFNPETVMVIDHAQWNFYAGITTSSPQFVSAQYTVELDDGEIDEIDVDVQGLFSDADRSLARGGLMWATDVPNATDNFNINDWVQIPFLPKFQASSVESDIGGGADTGSWAFAGNAAYNADNYDQGLYVAPGGESTSYVYVPGNSESSSTALQLTNGSLTGQVSVTAYNKQWQFDSNGDLTLPQGGDILDNNGNSVLGGGGGSNSPVQPYLELTNVPFITQAGVLGTPVTVTEPGSGQGAELDVLIENTGTTLGFVVATPGTGYVIGQRYKVGYWQIGGNGDINNLEVTVATVGEQGELLTVDNAVWTGPNTDGTYRVSIEYIPETEDSIEQGLTLTRFLYNGLYNIAVEPSFDSAISPATTLWNDDGWGTLTGLRDRAYSTFQTMTDNAPDNDLSTQELVMWDTVNDRYYKFDFSVWDNNNTGAFSYTRTLVTDPNYFRKTDNGEEVDVVVEHPDLSLLEETYYEAETIFGDFRDQDAAEIAPETRPWAGLPSYQAYDLILEYTPPEGVLPPSSGLAAVAASAQSNYLTWREALAVSVGITRDANNGIYNPYTEEGWNSDNSPLGTGWNIDGWDDLSDVEDRTYTNFYAAYGFGGLGNKVPGSKAVMYVPQTEKYYAVEWLSWTANNAGGGFSYTRKEIDLTKVNEGVKFPDGTVLKSAAGVGRVKSTASANRRIEEVTGYNQVSVTSRNTSNDIPATVYGTAAENLNSYLDIVWDAALDVYVQGTTAYSLEVSTDGGNNWYPAFVGGYNPDVSHQIVITNGLYVLQAAADSVIAYRIITGADPVVWWDKADLPGGSADFRGAVINYHAYTGESTIIGTIHIVDDDGEEHISHQEVQSGSSDGENDDLWLVTSEGQIRYRRIDGESKTLRIHWTAKVFYGSELYD